MAAAEVGFGGVEAVEGFAGAEEEAGFARGGGEFSGAGVEFEDADVVVDDEGGVGDGLEEAAVASVRRGCHSATPAGSPDLGAGRILG